MTPVGWVSVKDVLDSLGTPLLPSSDEAALRTAVDAVNVFLASARPDLPYPHADGPFDTLTQSAATAHGSDARIRLGAGMLASRWFQRRGTNDNATLGEFGVLPTIDRDLEHILGIGRASKPTVA